MRSGQTNPVVRTVHGAVGGRYEHDVAVFRGIPYAAPPLGDFRWLLQPVGPVDAEALLVDVADHEEQ